MEWLFLDFKVIRIDEIEGFEIHSSNAVWQIDVLYKDGKKEYVGCEKHWNDCHKRIKKLLRESKI